MPKVTKSLIPLLVLSLILCRVCMPVQASAADKITKIEPQYMSTPEEDIAGLPGKKKGSNYTTWVMVAVGVALVAALAGGGGGGGGGGDNNTAASNSGEITVGW